MKRRVEPLELGESRKEGGEKSRRPGRPSVIFKAVVLLAVVGVTTYGMLDQGIYDEGLWLPAAAGSLALLLVTLFVRGYYGDVPRAGWVMAAALGALVGVKGLSMVWTISETETINELLRSSMYLAVFLVVLGALSSARQVGPLMDIAVLIVTAEAGYGLLQKINPSKYPVTSLDGVRIDSTLEYPNTVAVVLGMGIALALARMTALRNAVLRGLYAALILAFLIALYLTVSRGGIGSLLVGVVALFVLSANRLQLLANLLLLGVPGVWLLWRVQDLEGLLRVNVSQQQRMADGAVFRTDLLVAMAAAFVLQAAYALLVNRYNLKPVGRRVLGALAVVATVLIVGGGALVVVHEYGGIGQVYQTLRGNPNQTQDTGQRLASLDLGFRESYWKVGWEEWKEHPLTGSGAGTFQYVWLENRPGTQGVKQVHNLYLEQGTETGVFAFLALVGFVVALVGYTARAAWRSWGERRLLLAGLLSALVVYLVSSALEWHWYLPGSTLLFFLLAAVAAKFACMEDRSVPEWDVGSSAGESAASR